MTDEGDNVESKIIFRPKKRAKCLRTKKASSDSEEENNEEDMRYLCCIFVKVDYCCLSDIRNYSEIRIFGPFLINQAKLTNICHLLL